MEISITVSINVIEIKTENINIKKFLLIFLKNKPNKVKKLIDNMNKGKFFKL